MTDQDRPVGWIAYNVDGTLIHFSVSEGWDIQCVSTDTNPTALLWGEQEFVQRTSARIAELEKVISDTREQKPVAYEMEHYHGYNSFYSAKYVKETNMDVTTNFLDGKQLRPLYAYPIITTKEQ